MGTNPKQIAYMAHILQKIGLRTTCCNKKLVAWSQTRFYCDGCHQVIGQSRTTSSRRLKIISQPSVRSLSLAKHHTA